MPTQIWRHITSGEDYVVEVEDGKVTAANGPLHYSEVDEALRLGVVNNDPEDSEWIEENKENFCLVKP